MAQVCQLLLLFVDSVGQVGVVVGNLGKVRRVLLERRDFIHGRGGHIVQVARQGVHHLFVWCAVLFETSGFLCFFSGPGFISRPPKGVSFSAQTTELCWEEVYASL